MILTPEKLIAGSAAEAVRQLWGAEVEASLLQVQITRKEFEGDYTLVVFPLLKISHLAPEATGNAIGQWMTENVPEVGGYNTVKGFLNVSLSNVYWNEVFAEAFRTADFGQLPATGKTIMVEFSSSNTSKPLHLGHVRNNLLGWSVSRLLEANGHKVLKVNLVNDRGIHICKSMLAWLKTANGETPETSGKKGDHLVGDCYVAFNDIYKKEVEELVAGGMSKEEAEKNAPSLKEAQEMLLKWEQGDPEVRALWEKMNSWVYQGFDKTYSDLGISFDRIYYESQTYLLGKALVQKGLDMGVFERHDDGSVWCDLTADGLDQKLLLRSDGTSVYMTQDLGTAERRFEEYNLDELIYVVGNEQNYHFQVLKLILKKLGFDWSDSIYHLSYGMVELPEGKMKSREGTVVDADDLLEKMYNTAKETSLELGKLDDMTPQEQDELFRMLSLGALKYFIIKVDPRKTMLFDPKESIDFNVHPVYPRENQVHSPQGQGSGNQLGHRPGSTRRRGGTFSEGSQDHQDSQQLPEQDSRSRRGSFSGNRGELRLRAGQGVQPVLSRHADSARGEQGRPRLPPPAHRTDSEGSRQGDGYPRHQAS